MDGVILIHGKMVLDYRSVNLISSILTKLLLRVSSRHVNVMLP